LSQLAVIASSCLVITLINPVAAIKCWECNSAYDKRCGDSFQNITSELVDCDQRNSQMTHLPLKEDGTRYTANVCRKTVQTANEETRVIRSCGWLPNPPNFEGRDCFTKTGTFQVMVYHCVCKHDGCNSSTRLGSNTITALLFSVAAFLYHKQI